MCPLTQPEAPNAALLIDFDNVTMGMRSDLSKELKNLLNSDIIKGKVTVQRAYADWRRYPQYIVPLSENSVDLIFAPAYGSSKKNATDIRMAIDAMELVFIRPEIGTMILLTGDSDFSSVVLKLKEYGKYVIGVGIQESSSDILVQNCDEYYSYTSLTGLRKTTDSANKPADPWILVEQAVKRMASRGDVMRSDRLKQVMMEMDPTFDEGNFGFSKFSRFLSEATSRGLVKLRKLDNGQYEIAVPGDGRGGAGSHRGEPSSHRGEETRKPESRERPKGRDREERVQGRGPREAPKEEAPDGRKGAGEAQPAKAASDGGDPLREAYDLLRKAVEELAAGDGGPVRDSDLKRKMLELEPSFDEGELGFGKFSRFLRQAHDHEIVDLEKREEGTYQVSLRGLGPSSGAQPPVGGGPSPSETKATEAPADEASRAPIEVSRAPDPRPDRAPPGQGAAAPAREAEVTRMSLRMRRGGSHHRKEPEGPPPLLEGQAVSPSQTGRAATSGPAAPGRRTPGPKRETPRDQTPEESTTTPQPDKGPINPAELGLPTDGPALVRYLTNSYKGVGQKTAETLVSEFGTGLYQVLRDEPDRLTPVIPARRAEQLLRGWRADYMRRVERASQEPGAPSSPQEGTPPVSRRRTRKGGRARGKGSGAASS